MTQGIRVIKREDTINLNKKFNSVQVVNLNPLPIYVPVPDYFTAQADENILEGQVLHLKATGHLGLAKADSILTTNVCGLARLNTLATFSCVSIGNNAFKLSDWTAVIGSVNLVLGSTYYLDPLNAGKMTDIAPTQVGDYVVKIGIAIKSDTLDVEIEPKILL